MRSYDAEGHITYIFYVFSHWTIPEPEAAWQFFQPPLYYFFSAILIAPFRSMHLDREFIIGLLQIESFLLTVVAFLAGIWVGTLLFRDEKKRRPLLIFSLLIAVFPAVIFPSSRISNDTPMLLVFFLSFGFLQRFWMQGKLRDWYIALIIIALGILTKSNAIPLLVAAFILLVLQRSLPRKQLFKHATLSIGILVSLVGWYVFLRILQGQEHIVGNIGMNNAKLFIQNWHWTNLFVFRPHALFEFPFYSSWDDTTGRPFLFEVLFKSALSGEWNFGSTANNLLRIIYVFNFFFFFLCLRGLISAIKHSSREHLPLIITGVIFIVSMMALVAQKHVGGLQDFRYVPILLLPIFYFTVKGALSLSESLQKIILPLFPIYALVLTTYIGIVLAEI
ncbi:MAG TPA: glycosyltransferase family 39 protein [Candidatus Peribacterales bacterium]|nr:glycosyltransferase family 39 protein [Candidatus Peribacterales bacterium]